MPVDKALGIDNHLVGHRAEPISRLGVLVAISYNPLAALLKLHQFIAQRLHRCRTIGCEHASLDIYTLDIVVGLCFVNSLSQIIKSQRAHLASCEETVDIVLRTFLHHTIEIEHENRVVLYLWSGVGGSHHSQYRNHSDNSHCHCEYQYSHYSGKCLFHEIFHNIYINNFLIDFVLSII